MLLDNRFLDSAADSHVLHIYCYTPVNFISVGNTYSVPQPFDGNIGRDTSVDDSVTSDAASPPTVPTEIYVPPLDP